MSENMSEDLLQVIFSLFMMMELILNFDNFFDDNYFIPDIFSQNNIFPLFLKSEVKCNEMAFFADALDLQFHKISFPIVLENGYEMQ